MSQLSDKIANPKKRGEFWKPARIVLAYFLTLILVGTFLLWLPVSTAESKSTEFPTALFTATSAVTVTGLVRVDTGSYWSGFGQLVILLLVEAGGLGITSSTVFLLLLFRRRPNLQDRLTIQSGLGKMGGTGVFRLSLFILKFTLTFQATGAFFLFLGWVEEHGPVTAAEWAIFHSVMAFNNAGFDLTGTVDKPFVSLTGYTSNFMISLTLPALVIAGSIGFPVLAELFDRQPRRRFSLQTRVVVWASLVLLLAGTLLFWLAEKDNPATLKPLGFPEQVVAAFFQSASPRTAGFNSVNLGGLNGFSLLLIILLMFIGGGSGSTAGGMRVGTLVVALTSIRTTLLNRPATVIFKKTIPQRTISMALAIGAFYIFGITLFTLLLTVIENQLPLRWVFFEVVSAFCTVGLSLGATVGLTLPSQLLIIIAMIVGRLGPVLLLVAFSRTQGIRSRVGYPEEEIAVG